MSTYDDYDQPRERRRRDDRPAPYPQEDDTDRRSRPTRAAEAPPVSGSQVGRGNADIPPPPLGSAMKRDGSQSRVPNLKPEFPDEASYLNGRSPDLERKTGDRDRRFRERRDGYTSDEGEALRSDPRRTRSTRDVGRRQRPPYNDDDDRALRRPPPAGTASEASMPIRDRPQGDRGHRSEGEDSSEKRRPPRDYDDRRRRPARDYDDPPRRSTYDDEDAPPPRRRRPVEYGADPVRASRRDDDGRRPPRDARPSRRYNDEEGEDDGYRPSRRKSNPPPRRSNRYDDDDDYYDRDPRDAPRRREDDREPRRPARRRSYDDDDDDYYRRKRDDRDPRDGRDRRDDRRKEPTHMKIGNMDVGPAIDKGQKYYASLAPILTPLVMNYLKNRK